MEHFLYSKAYVREKRFISIFIILGWGWGEATLGESLMVSFVSTWQGEGRGRKNGGKRKKKVKVGATSLSTADEKGKGQRKSSAT